MMCLCCSECVSLGGHLPCSPGTDQPLGMRAARAGSSRALPRASEDRDARFGQPKSPRVCLKSYFELFYEQKSRPPESPAAMLPELSLICSGGNLQWHRNRRATLSSQSYPQKQETEAPRSTSQGLHRPRALGLLNPHQ